MEEQSAIRGRPFEEDALRNAIMEGNISAVMELVGSRRHAHFSKRMRNHVSFELNASYLRLAVMMPTTTGEMVRYLVEIAGCDPFSAFDYCASPVFVEQLVLSGGDPSSFEYFADDSFVKDIGRMETFFGERFRTPDCLYSVLYQRLLLGAKFPAHVSEYFDVRSFLRRNPNISPSDISIDIATVMHVESYCEVLRRKCAAIGKEYSHTKGVSAFVSHVRCLPFKIYLRRAYMRAIGGGEIKRRPKYLSSFGVESDIGKVFTWLVGHQLRGVASLVMSFL